ncbi:hypothetical protein [Aquimarina sp. 2201CG14-23]|uniref:hypothetical protein n=1 Tax=Aquimarina mycalae TaxID=3040073 RepID=UPI0024782B67|nr:hypothetical protein [Aquimarina sp. 2201CG14-23]MDH7445644.1 hypothetical protein [Aquimarina sp. 2201CG14-23]
MKRFYLILFSVLLFSCSNDDDNSEPTLQGQWNLVNVSGGFTGLDEDIAKGVIVWDFNTTTGMVTIMNDITDSSFNTILESGTYTYSVSAPADADLLIVNEVDYGRLNLEQAAFTVQETFTDGFTFRFER